MENGTTLEQPNTFRQKNLLNRIGPPMTYMAELSNIKRNKQLLKCICYGCTLKRKSSQCHVEHFFKSLPDWCFPPTPAEFGWCLINMHVADIFFHLRLTWGNKSTHFRTTSIDRLKVTAALGHCTPEM